MYGRWKRALSHPAGSRINTASVADRADRLQCAGVYVFDVDIGGGAPIEAMRQVQACIGRFGQVLPAPDSAFDAVELVDPLSPLNNRVSSSVAEKPCPAADGTTP